MCRVFQPCAPRRAPTVAPACAGTSVCAPWAGPEPAATQVRQKIAVKPVHTSESDCSKVLPLHIDLLPLGFC